MANQNPQHNQSSGSRPGSSGASPEKTDQSKTQQSSQRVDRKHESEEFKKTSLKETGSGGLETSEDEDMG